MVKSSVKEQVREILEDAGLYKTASRLAILAALKKASRPLSPDEIARRLGENVPDKTTIYRTLERLCEANVVHRAFIRNRAEHYELADRCGTIGCHPHFTCTGCGVTKCLTEISVPIVKGLKKGFIIERQQVRLEGLCPRCKV